MKIIKFAIVGCGAIGSRHVSVICNEKMAELVAVCDKDEEKCKKISSEHNNIPYYTSYKKMLDCVKVDIVDVCTPNFLHAKMSIDAMNKGNNVLVEKPLSLTASDSKKMIATAKKNKVKLFVVKQNRFNRPVAFVQKLIAENKLGKILMINTNVLWNRNNEYYSKSDWRGKIKLEGGSLYTQASHFVDLLIWWCGDVVSAKTTIATKNHKIETEDCGVSILKFKKGGLGLIEWTTCIYEKNYEGSITIIAEKGTIKIGGQYLNKIEYWNVESIPCPDPSVIEENKIYERDKGTKSNHDLVISNYISILNNNGGELVGGEEGIKTIEAIEKIYKSSK